MRLDLSIQQSAHNEFAADVLFFPKPVEKLWKFLRSNRSSLNAEMPTPRGGHFAIYLQMQAPFLSGVMFWENQADGIATRQNLL